MKRLLLIPLLAFAALAQKTIYTDALDVWTREAWLGADTSSSRLTPTRTASTSKTTALVGLRYSQTTPDIEFLRFVDDGTDSILSLGSPSATYGPTEIRFATAASYGGTPVIRASINSSGTFTLAPGSATSSGGTRIIATEAKVGTDLTGATLRLTANSPTGNADGGPIQLYTTRDGGSSGTTQRSPSLSVDVTKNGLLGIYPWTAGDRIAVGGTYDVDSVIGGNTGSSETDLATKTHTGGLVGNSGERCVLKAFGSFAGNANNKRIRVYFGGTAIMDTTALALNGGVWDIESRVYRISSTTAKAVTVFRSSNAVLPGWVETSLSMSITWANSQVFKITGTATSDNDITCDVCEWNVLPK